MQTAQSCVRGGWGEIPMLECEDIISKNKSGDISKDNPKDYHEDNPEDMKQVRDGKNDMA